MEDLKNVLAENLIKYRKAANLTQAELAEKINYSDKAVSKWERAAGMPDVDVLKQIADLFGVTVDDMLTKSDKPARVKRKINLLTRTNVTIVPCCSCGWWPRPFSYSPCSPRRR